MVSNGTAVEMRVGQLARRTGLSVRTLHYYDEIGLLTPPRRAESGYRLYGEPEIRRLQQIASLRQLGFGLEEIREILARPGTSVERIVELHLERINEQIEELQRLRDRLSVIARGLRTTGSVTVETLLETMEAMKHMEKYYTPEQLETLRKRAESIGEEHIKEVEAEWPVLIAKVQAEFDQGTPPSDPKVQALARRWMELVHEFTGGDPGIAHSVQRMWKEENVVHGTDATPVRELGRYVQQAIASTKTE